MDLPDGDLKILVYVLTNEWYIHPWTTPEPGRGYATIDQDGLWRIPTVWRDHQARRLALILTKKEAPAPPRVRAAGNADRELLRRVDHLAAAIMAAPPGI